MVDPLDGTREFIAGRDEFTVNVALLRGGRPVLGVVAAPALGLVWRGGDGLPAERLRLAAGAPASAAQERAAIRCRALPREGLVAAVSRSHLDARTRDLLARLPVTDEIVCGSALKFCRVAEGAADVYPAARAHLRMGRGRRPRAGGGRRRHGCRPDGTPLPYGRIADNFRIPAFIAWGDPSAPAKLGL